MPLQSTAVVGAYTTVRSRYDWTNQIKSGTSHPWAEEYTHFVFKALIGWEKYLQTLRPPTPPGLKFDTPCSTLCSDHWGVGNSGPGVPEMFLVFVLHPNLKLRGCVIRLNEHRWPCIGVTQHVNIQALNVQVQAFNRSESCDQAWMEQKGEISLALQDPWFTITWC